MGFSTNVPLSALEPETSLDYDKYERTLKIVRDRYQAVPKTNG